MTRYEYRIISGNPKPATERQLNELTSTGWEVVSSHTNSDGFFMFFFGVLVTVTTFVLRRPLA